MRVVLSDLGTAVGLTLLSLTAVATIEPTESAAMSVGARTPLVRAGIPGVRAVDDDISGSPVNGRRLFLSNNCYICHGGRGGGGMCPSLREDKPDEDRVAEVLENGTRSGMPSFARLLTDQNIQDLAAYIKSLRTNREPTFTHWWDPTVP